jgi:hypothetical protein
MYQTPARERLQEAQQLVVQLGSDDFQEREEASARLLLLGEPARGTIQPATQSEDPEVRFRAMSILGQLNAGARSEEQRLILLSLFRESAERRIAGVTPLALALLPLLDEPSLRHAAQEAAWHCVRDDDLPAVESALAGSHPAARAAALVACERLRRQEAETLLLAGLTDGAAEVRLAACRALLPSRPQACLEALVGLLDDPDVDAGREAWKLLQRSTGKQPAATAMAPAQSAWRTIIAELEPQAPFRSIGDRDRLWWGCWEMFIEEFHLAGEIEQRYRTFRYRATLAARASVKGGVLLLDGQHDEGDQWLEIDALTAMGQPDFGRRLRVATRLGGEADGSGGYHAGVVVGNLKVVIHPAYRGAGLRIERDDNHQYVSQTEDIGITPLANTIYNLIVDVSSGDDHTAEVTVTFSSDGDPSHKVRRTYQVNSQDIGPLTRVALVRSGRTGGAAIFDRLEISPRP